MSDDIKELKAQADKLGVKYSPNIGKETLQERVSKAIEKKAMTPVAVVKEVVAVPVSEETPQQRKQRKTKEANKLVRVRVTCMDPKQKLKNGVTLQLSNSVIGTIGKHIQFEVPWHVPQAILNLMKDKQHQAWISGKSQYGITKKIPKLVSTYAVEVLPPLTPVEFEELKTRQAMAGNMRDV